jgi:23S rRNA pseudouridine955/2504/2580 synthase
MPGSIDVRSTTIAVGVFPTGWAPAARPARSRGPDNASLRYYNNDTGMQQSTAMVIPPEATVPATRQVRQMKITPEHAGRRIDNFLAWVLKGVPKGRIYRMLRSGEARVNGGRVRPAYRICPGDRLRIPPVHTEAPKNQGRDIPEWLEITLRDAVVYEDPDLLALAKPAGVAVHSGTGVSLGLIEALRAMRPEEPYLELVHRLDRDTSGCLLVARRPEALRALHGMLRAGRIEKTYLTLLRGRWRGGAEVVDLGLRRDVVRSGERMVSVATDGKPARTVFAPLELFRSASLMEARLITGRTHQIRVHAMEIDHPIAGDAKYGDKGFNRVMRDLGLRDLFLHSHRISLVSPGSGVPISIVTELPAALRGVLQALRANK